MFRRRTFFHGRVHTGATKDIAWLTPEAREITEDEWRMESVRCMGVFLSGRGLAERDEWGQTVEDDDLVLLINAQDGQIDFTMPGPAPKQWTALIDTARDEGANGPYQPGDRYPLQSRSLALLHSKPE